MPKIDRKEIESKFIDLMIDIGKNHQTFTHRNNPIVVNQRVRGITNMPSDLESLINLFKGLVLCERDFRWMGGSTASNIRVYQHLINHPDIKDSQDQLDEILDWALRNKGDNGYTPLNTHRYFRCVSLDDVKNRDEELLKIRRTNEEARRKIQAEKEKRVKLYKELNQLKLARRAVNYQSYKIKIALFELQSLEQKFTDVIHNKLNFPIGLMPSEEWDKIIAGRKLSICDIHKLIEVIPRNTNESLRLVRQGLIRMKQPMLVKAQNEKSLSQ